MCHKYWYLCFRPLSFYPLHLYFIKKLTDFVPCVHATMYEPLNVHHINISFIKNKKRRREKWRVGCGGKNIYVGGGWFFGDLTPPSRRWFTGDPYPAGYRDSCASGEVPCNPPFSQRWSRVRDPIPVIHAPSPDLWGGSWGIPHNHFLSPWVGHRDEGPATTPSRGGGVVPLAGSVSFTTHLMQEKRWGLVGDLLTLANHPLIKVG